jgi:hypothetical protein
MQQAWLTPNICYLRVWVQGIIFRNSYQRRTCKQPYRYIIKNTWEKSRTRKRVCFNRRHDSMPILPHTYRRNLESAFETQCNQFRYTLTVIFIWSAVCLKNLETYTELVRLKCCSITNKHSTAQCCDEKIHVSEMHFNRRQSNSFTQITFPPTPKRTH